MSELPFAATTPVSVARVGLKAREADKLADFYRTIVGLQELSRDGETITLGSPGRPLLVLERDAAAKPDDPRAAGLFHTAFLLPSRADLGRWINHAIADRIQIDGASDSSAWAPQFRDDGEEGALSPADLGGGHLVLARKSVDMAELRS